MNTAYREEPAAASCARCGWPTTEGAVLSTHHTSEGWVRYRRCPCGSVTIELVQLDERRTVHA
ncbi:hypothetical protein [Pseudonocardia humida]|uniref:Ogr/Delta-like zinc finger protein n=1 Tax=Pseudonocardia humida TaxID=2800819 RepID=A0ABT1A3G7_9PSEU|nr:hypothetical protein [Pseudonocardia humida]MCO1657550.1 hypothetical protein [Pseudonocardia humida]